jgi:hypothetical protein
LVIFEQHRRRMTEILAFLAIHDDLALRLAADVHDGDRVARRQLRFEVLRRRERDVGLLELRLSKGRRQDSSETWRGRVGKSWR